MSYTYMAHDKRVLAWCNKIRAKLGKKPVRMIRKGVPHRLRECALAKTIGSVVMASCCRDISKTHWGGKNFAIPEYVRFWLIEFDEEKLPHFIAKGDSHA